jgi:hypothetical protein
MCQWCAQRRIIAIFWLRGQHPSTPHFGPFVTPGTRKAPTEARALLCGDVSHLDTTSTQTASAIAHVLTCRFRPHSYVLVSVTLRISNRPLGLVVGVVRVDGSEGADLGAG